VVGKRTPDERAAVAQGLWFVEPRLVRSAPIDLPEPADGEVLVRTTFSGISAGTELLAYRGQLDPDLPLDETIGALGGTFRYPFRYGYSCVGVVEDSRAALPVGTRVFAFQPHQDRFVAAADAVVPLGAVDDRCATLFPLVETALQIALDAGTVLGLRVLVFGLGAVGTLTSLMLRRAGAEVIAVDPLPWRRDLVGRLGVPCVDPGGVEAALGPARGGTGTVPLVVEASGNPEALRGALRLLDHEGTALVASWYGTKEVTLPLGAEFHRRRLTLRSTQVSTIPARLGHQWTPQRRRARVADLLDELPLADLATHTFAFDDAADAYAAVDAGRDGLLHAALGYE
jgi:2-desacetyl-2-hydroxyethyl bacteriochlorophyllide A dehydrogenase